MILELIEYATGKEYLKFCSHWLNAFPLHNNMILGNIADQDTYSSEIRYFALEDAGKMCASAILLNGRLMIGYHEACEEHCRLLVAELIKADCEIASLFGLNKIIQGLSANVRERSIESYTMLLQECRQVLPVGLGVGALKGAETKDYEWITQWIYDFWQTVHIFPKPDMEFARTQARQKIVSGQLYYWERDGEPCAMGGVMRVVANTAYIGLIYTPSSKRGHGYGMSISEALTKNLLNHRFASVALYSELENIPANRIYQQVGFAIVDHFTDVHLSSKSQS